MKLVKWKFNSLEVPMIEINGELYCTSKAICSALNISLDTFKKCHRHQCYEIGNSLEGQNDPLREFLAQHKAYLDIKRVKADLNLWSEQQMFLFAVHISSPTSIQFRKDLWNFVKEHAKRSMVSLEMYRELEARTVMQDHALKEITARLDAMETPMGQIASASGRLLRMQKDVKPFRTNRSPKIA